ncbi:MAG: RNA 2',3'-cyclic phosphodiesterase [Spirochaetota bacterium]
MDELRLFTAVSPPQEIAEKIAGVQRRFESAVGPHVLRTIRRENYHVTLQFLGNTPPSLVEPVVEAMQAAASRSSGPIELQLTAPGAFPTSRRPRTLWVGLRDTGGRLTALEEDLRERLVRLGIELDTRRFRPHVTIAYVRKQATSGDRARVAAAIEHAQQGGERGEGPSPRRSAAGSTPDAPAFTVTDLLLVRSVTGPGGSEYSHLHAVRLE